MRSEPFCMVLLALFLHARPGVAQCYGAVEDRFFLAVVLGIGTEIADAFELEGGALFGFGQRWFGVDR